MSGFVHAPEPQECRPRASGAPSHAQWQHLALASEKKSKTRLGVGHGHLLFDSLSVVVLPCFGFKLELNFRLCVRGG